MSTNIIPEVYWLSFDDNDISGTTIINRASNSSSYTATIPSGVDICLNTIEIIEGSGSLQLSNIDSASKVNYVQLSSMTAPNSFTATMWIKPILNDETHSLWQFNNGNNGGYNASVGIYRFTWHYY